MRDVFGQVDRPIVIKLKETIAVLCENPAEAGFQKGATALRRRR